MPCSERRKELKRRRHRHKKMARLMRRVEKASVSEKAHISQKIRKMTPGAEQIVERLGLEQR